MVNIININLSIFFIIIFFWGGEGFQVSEFLSYHASKFPSSKFSREGGKEDQLEAYIYIYI